MNSNSLVNASSKQAIKILRTIRKHQVEKPEIVVALGSNILSQCSSLLSSTIHLNTGEYWLIAEQVFLAALQIDEESCAKRCLDLLRTKFPSSQRVQRLHAIQMETLGDYDRAHQLYTQMVENRPTDRAVRKRQVALAKSYSTPSQSSSSSSSAINLLVDYLSVFMSDQNAWKELYALYMQMNQFKRALFCLEEIMLAQPENFHLYTRYADILYSMGGVENVKKARKYYAHALDKDLSHNNMRAMIGLLLSTQQLSKFLKNKANQNENTLLFDAVREKVISHYTALGHDKIKPIMAKVLEALNE